MLFVKTHYMIGKGFFKNSFFTDPVSIFLFWLDIDVNNSFLCFIGPRYQIRIFELF